MGIIKNCPHCGAEIITDNNTVEITCEYCRSVISLNPVESADNTENIAEGNVKKSKSAYGKSVKVLKTVNIRQTDNFQQIISEMQMQKNKWTKLVGIFLAIHAVLSICTGFATQLISSGAGGSMVAFDVLFFITSIMFLTLRAPSKSDSNYALRKLGTFLLLFFLYIIIFFVFFIAAFLIIAVFFSLKQ